MEFCEKTIKYSKPSDEIFISGLGDVHMGNIGCDKKLLKTCVKWLCNNEAYVVGMGDMIEAINLNDKRFDIRTIDADMRSELDNLVSEQMNALIDIVSEIPKDRWIGIHTGNHEEKIRLGYYRDVTRDLCRELGTKYLGWEAWTRLRFERGGVLKPSHTEVYKMFTTHGSGGGRKDASKQAKIQSIIEYVDADLTMMGHVHSIQIGRGVKQTIPTVGELHAQNNTYGWMITGSFLDKNVEGVTGYAERNNMPPTKTGISTFRIIPETRKIHIMA
jgi:hypothetical protein